MPGAIPPSRFPNGLNNVNERDPLGMFGMPDPTKWHTYFDDFDYYVAADWVITATGAGTTALTDLDGGCILVTNAAADNDARFHQKVGEGFLLAAGKRAVFKARFRVSNAIESDFIIGLYVLDTTPLDVVDGVYFMKDDGDAQLDVYCRKDAGAGSNSALNIATIVADTFLTVAWYYDGVSTLFYYVNDVLRGTLSATSAFLPDTELTVGFGVQNGDAVARTLTLDYLFMAQER